MPAKEWGERERALCQINIRKEPQKNQISVSSSAELVLKFPFLLSFNGYLKDASLNGIRSRREWVSRGGNIRNVGVNQDRKTQVNWKSK